MEENQGQKKVILDGQEVERDRLEEAKKNMATRIVETKDGEFKTLQKLKGVDD